MDREPPVELRIRRRWLLTVAAVAVRTIGRLSPAIAGRIVDVAVSATKFQYRTGTGGWRDFDVQVRQ